MPSTASTPSVEATFFHRLLSLVFVASCMVLCVYAFGSQIFSADLNSAEGVDKLVVSHITPAASIGSIVAMPDSWSDEASQGASQRHYQVSLPVGAKFQDYALYLSAYRQTVGVYFQDRLIASGGNKKIIWLDPSPKPLIVPLAPFAELASQTGEVIIDIKVWSSETGEGGLAGVWYGSRKAIADAKPFYVSLMTPLLHANIGILSALMLFLAIDSLRSVESRLRLLMVIPHLSYALLCLPEIEFLSTIAWLKLYLVSINSIVLIWIYAGCYALGVYRRWLGASMVIIALVSLPALFINDYQVLKTWIYDIQSPFIGSLGVVIFLYFGWSILDSADRTLHMIMLFAGANLTGAGINDISLNVAGNEELRYLVLPVAVVIVSVVLLVWISLEMLQRNRKISKQQEHMRELFDLRTDALGEAKSKLVQHQRYQALNTMGAAISHEIKNPLAALSNDLALLEMKLKKANSIDAPIERMQRTVQRIDSTITELTDFSRRQTAHKKMVPISEWVGQLSTSAEIQALLGDINFQVAIEPSIEAKIDEGLMRRALVNVLDNAVSALHGSESPEVRMHVQASEDTSHVEISIFDNGCGLVTDAVEDLFEPLVSGSERGLGLGLAIVRDIMELHLGDVKLRNNTTGAGAVVSLFFPKM